MPKCPDPRPCFAQDAIGNCEILTDTLFTRSCPFYKPPVAIDDNAEFEIRGYAGKFKKIKGYSYFVSTEGVILNNPRKPLKPVFDRSKCEMRVLLYHNGASRWFNVASLVAAAFLPGEGRVYFKNGDKKDCRLENLERR